MTWLRRWRLVIPLVWLFSLLLERTGAGQDFPLPEAVQLRVLVPQADAKLFVFDSLTDPNGIDRRFYSSPLTPGQQYYYLLKVVWEPNNYTRITRTRRVDVQAGGQYEVDLQTADARHPDDLLIRYVPTPNEVVDAMLKLGQVGNDDVVFDLGCGDGRIVIDAIRRYGARRGVGVDIDSQRIRESLANADKLQVADKVEFREGDVLQEIDDLAEASVVMLYMGDDVNLRLRPILRTTLKPGSRVVSHRFTMGDWMPEKTVVVKDQAGTEYQLHLWTIDAGTEEVER